MSDPNTFSRFLFRSSAPSCSTAAFGRISLGLRGRGFSLDPWGRTRALGRGLGSSVLPPSIAPPSFTSFVVPVSAPAV